MKAFEPAIQRAHFTFHNIQEKSSHIVSPSLSDPCDFGLKWHDALKVYQPILTTNLPAPESIIELRSPKCQTGCNSGRCRCHKNSLVYSEMCLCQNCQNSVEEYEMPLQDDDDAEWPVLLSRKFIADPRGGNNSGLYKH